MTTEQFVTTCARITSGNEVEGHPVLSFKKAESWNVLTQFAEAVDTSEAKWGRLSRFFSCYASSCTILAGLRPSDGRCFLAHVVGHSTHKESSEVFKLAEALKKYVVAGDPGDGQYQFALFTQGEKDLLSGNLWGKASIKTIHFAFQNLAIDTTNIAKNSIIVTGHGGSAWSVKSSGVAIGPGKIYCFVGDEKTPLKVSGQSENPDMDRNRGMYGPDAQHRGMDASELQRGSKMLL
jgi:hypothetical protein